MCMMGSSFRHSLGRASMVYRGSKQQILDWALESTKTWFNCLFEWLIFLHLYGVSLSTVFLVLYLNISSLLPSCHYSTTMHRTSNGNGLYQNNCRRPRLQPSFREGTDDGYIRAISRATLHGVLFPKQAWNMMSTHGPGPCPILLFPCTILASISICWYLVLVILPHSLPIPAILVLTAVLP